MSNAARLLTLPKIFADRFFKIPDYQRGYSWWDDQLWDLRKDIQNLYGKSHVHFTGTIVAAKTADPVHFEIVDGQQRITTLLILVREIYLTDPIKYATLADLYFQRGSAGNKENVLTPNEETRVFFEDKILNNGSPDPKIKSHWCIANAQEFFRKWLGESSENPDKVLQVVTNLLGFILYTPKGDKEIGIMFEVINNRGKKLSELEKIKNYFIYFATVHQKAKLRETINDKWREIQENLSIAYQTDNHEEDSFLRFCFVVFYEPNKEKSHAVYDQMKHRYSPQETDQDKIDRQVEEMQRFVGFLSNASRSYAYFFNSGHYQRHNAHPHTARIEKALTYLRCHPVNASIMPMYLAVMNSFHQPQPAGVDVGARVADLLELIEKANFRLYVLPGVFKRADTRQGDMFFFANEFYRVPTWVAAPGDDSERARFNGNVSHKGDIYDWLETELREMILSQCPQIRFVQALTLDTDEDYDYYNWRDGMRFFLSCYEEKMKADHRLGYDIEKMLISRSEAGKHQNEYLSIEHIWARENRSDDFGWDHLEKRRLGNLVLMGLIANIQQTNDDIIEKVAHLVHENHIGRGSLNLHQVAELPSYVQKALAHPNVAVRAKKTKNYYLEIAVALSDLRETDLIHFALKRWGLPSESKASFIKVDSFAAIAEGRNYTYQVSN